ENVRVGPAWKAGADGLAHLRTRAVTAGNEARPAVTFVAIRPAHARRHASGLVDKANELGAPFDADAERLESRDQKLFMLILREDRQERIRLHPAAQGVQ